MKNILFIYCFQVAGLDLNDCGDSDNLCGASAAIGAARYVPPHLRGGNNNFADPEREKSGGKDNRSFKENRDYRENRDYNRDFRDNRDYRNDNRRYVKFKLKLVTLSTLNYKNAIYYFSFKKLIFVQTYTLSFLEIYNCKYI